jgi:hypothetical protein
VALGGQNWKRRFFVLTPGTLFYFVSDTEEALPKGVIPLHGYQVRLADDSAVQNCAHVMPTARLLANPNPVLLRFLLALN